MSTIINGTSSAITFPDSTVQNSAALASGGTIASGTITTATISTLNAPSGVLATQNGMTGVPKAWVNFTSTATPSISGSFNVSSVTYSATGNYTVAFTTAMPNSTYSVVSGGNYGNGAGYVAYGTNMYSLSASSFVAQTWISSGASLWGASGSVYLAIMSS